MVSRQRVHSDSSHHVPLFVVSPLYPTKAVTAEQKWLGMRMQQMKFSTWNLLVRQGYFAKCREFRDSENSDSERFHSSPENRSLKSRSRSGPDRDRQIFGDPDRAPIEARSGWLNFSDPDRAPIGPDRESKFRVW